MIGSTEFADALCNVLRGPIEKWEDTLVANHEDFVHVDGEEGDFGIISYYGASVGGVENTLMMVKYVNGGDTESTYYTEQGARFIRDKLFVNSISSVFDRALMQVLNPDHGEFGMKIGEIKAAKEHDERHRLRMQIEYPINES